MIVKEKKGMFFKEYGWRGLSVFFGLFVIALTIIIGAFLIYKGSDTFLVFGHTLWEFLGSAEWEPVDNAEGGGAVGALIFIAGSLCVCGLALLIATPFALGSAIFMTQISPRIGEKFYRPVVEIFAGIPSVVYGWVGLTVLVPAIRVVFDRQVGRSRYRAVCHDLPNHRQCFCGCPWRCSGNLQRCGVWSWLHTLAGNLARDGASGEIRHCYWCCARTGARLW